MHHHFSTPGWIFFVTKKDACDLIPITSFKSTRYIHWATYFGAKPYDYCQSVKSIYSSPNFPTSCSMFAFCFLVVKVYSLSFLRSDNSKLTINFPSPCVKILTPYHLHWLVVRSVFHIARSLPLLLTGRKRIFFEKLIRQLIFFLCQVNIQILQRLKPHYHSASSSGFQRPWLFALTSAHDSQLLSFGWFWP